MAESGIYEIVNLRNGKRYVGSAVRPVKRWAQHRHSLRNGKHHSRALQRAWDKYGETAFAFRMIEICDLDRLIEREQHFIDSTAPEYNCSKTAGSSRGVRWSSEAKQRKSEQTKNYFEKHPEARLRLSQAKKGKPSPQKGMKLTAEQRERLVIRPAGWAHTAEAKAKIGAAAKATWAEPTYRERHATAQKASITPELRARLSDVQRARWLDPDYRKKMSQVAIRPEVLEHNRQAARERWQDPGYRERVCSKLKGRIAHNKGKPISPEQRAKQAEAMRRKYAEDPEFRRKISERTKEAMAAPAIREKCRQANLGRKHSPEERAKRAASLRGKRRTPEQRAAMSERTKAYYARLRASDLVKE